MKLFLILILFLFYFINNSISLLIQSETDCLTNLIEYSGNKNNFKKRSDSLYSYYCEDYSNNFKCNQDGLLVSLVLNNNNLGNILSSSNIECFKKESLDLNLNIFVLDSEFLYSSKFNNFTMTLNGCRIQSFNKPITNLNSLTISTSILFSFSFTINLSTISNLISLTLIDNSGVSNLNVNFQNDLNPTTGAIAGDRLKNLITDHSSTISNFENLKNLENVIFRILKTTTIDAKTGFNNLSTWKTVKSISITSDNFKYFTFPSDSLKQLESLESLSFTNVYFSSVTDASIDLSSMKSLKQFSLVNTGSSFSTDAFSKLPLLKSFTINLANVKSAYPFYGLFNGNGRTPVVIESIKAIKNTISDNLDIVNQLPLIKSLREIDLSDNRLRGTVSSEFCKIKQLNVANNWLSGTLPTCYTCHTVGGKNTVLKNNFSGILNLLKIDGIPCTTLLPNLKFDVAANKTILFGTDLGFDVDYFISYPTTNDWILDVPSYSFYRNGIDIDVFDFQFIYPNQRFTLSANRDKPPTVTSVYVSKVGELTIIGTGFSYNITGTELSILNIQYCSIKSATYSKIVCQLFVYTSAIQSLIDAPTLLRINGMPNLLFNVSYLPDFTNYYLNCSQDCTGKGFCDRNSGQCICNCHGQGSCDIRKRACSCFTFWLGDECIVPDHYVSSIIASNILGGNTTLNGWYGPVHDNLSVYIGDLECKPIYSITTGQIICEIGPSNGLKSVTVTQNGHTWKKDKIYLYNNTLLDCPNDCTNATLGTCDQRTGQCHCLLPNFIGPDCSIEVIDSNPPKSNTTVDTDNGSTNLNNEKTKYTIQITKLVELDYNGNQVNQFNLLNNNWNFKKVTNKTNSNNSSNSYSSSNNSYSTESINDNDDENDDISKSTFYIFEQKIQTNCLIIYTIEEVGRDRNVSFASVNFKLTQGSIKLTVEIYNYTYSSSLNTIQLQMESSVDLNGTSGTEKYCESDKTEITNTGQDSVLNYITITREGKTLYGRFINKAISDDRETYVSSSTVSKNESSITIGINLSHCTNCIVDPDFSILVGKSSQDFKSTCTDDNNNSNQTDRVWFLPVVIVVPIVSCTIIIIVSLVIYTKHRRYLKLKLNSFLDPSIKMKDIKY